MGEKPNQWAKAGTKAHHGIALPVSAIHSKKSSGIGEFLDLIPVLEWMQRVGMDTLQLLPLTDSDENSSPYYTISSTALNPIFLSLHALPYRKIALPSFENKGRIDYPRVWEQKSKWLAEYLKEARKSLLKEPEYLKFKEETPWLYSYAGFIALKKKNGSKPWWEWTIDKVNEDEVEDHLLLQYLLDKQLKQVSEEAQKRGIFLFGDGPILCIKDSVEYFANEALFCPHTSVGYPPDPYSQEGQLWGFPPYNWEALEKDNFQLWKDRLKSYERYFSLFRLDHIIGFFRLWLIPEGEKPRNGYYLPSEEAGQLTQGTELLKLLLNNTKMLLLGEDLGIIPTRVREIMTELCIPGTRVMRWEKNWDTTKNFIPGNQYPPLSMTTLSTHDSETLAEWWDLNPAEAQAFTQTFSLPYEEKVTPSLRFKILQASHQTSSYFHINPLQEYLSLEQDWSFTDPKQERINIPGTVTPFNWTFRTLPPIEEWTTRQTFSDQVKKLTSPS
jgi:4-alpha-glucanotransferase